MWAGGMNGEELALLGRTAVHLRPGQVAHRARLRTQRAALRRWPKLGQRLLAGADPSAAAAGRRASPRGRADRAGRWPSLAELRTGRIRLLGLIQGTRRASPAGSTPTRRSCGGTTCTTGTGPGAWPRNPTGRPPRPCSPGCGDPGRRPCGFGRGDAWLPYPAALRAWSWCGLYRDLVAGSDLEPEFLRGLAAHAGFLRRHLESDVGGNHLIKGLKALAGLAVFFADERLLGRALQRLTAQLAVQVLPDGGHYERAPAYHCQVLGRPHRRGRPAQRGRAGARAAS